MAKFMLKPDRLTQEAVIVRIYKGVQGPVAMLHREGPVREGAEFLFVPEGAEPVPAQLAIAEKLHDRSGCPIYVQIDDVDWDPSWGELSI